MMTTYNAVVDFIKKSPNVGIYYNDDVISYDQLYDHVSRYSNLLSKRFEAGDNIMIMMSDCPEYFYLFWGAVKAGIIPSLVSTMLTTDQYNHIHNKKDYDYVFNDSNIEEFDAAATDLTDNPPVDANPDDLCFYLFSSGTTGYIKDIPHNHKDMAAVAINYGKKTLNITAYDVCFSTAKLSFAYGLGNSMLFPLFNQAATVLMSDKCAVKNTLDAIEKYKPTVFFSVPSLYANLVKSVQTSGRDFESVRLCVSAGEPLPGAVKISWEYITGKILIDGLGTTEALHIFISNRVEDHEPNCTGRLVPGYKAKVIDPNGNEVADGESGFLLIKGDSIPGGDWLNTGDMVIRRGSKYYYLGRSNDMIKIGGVWVSPTVIESKLIEHPDVLEVGVIQASDEIGFIKPKAYVVLQDHNIDKVKTKIELKRMCINELPTNHYPAWIEFVESLPKTPTGKIQRFHLRTWDAFSEPNQIESHSQ